MFRNLFLQILVSYSASGFGVAIKRSVGHVAMARPHFLQRTKQSGLAKAGLHYKENGLGKAGLCKRSRRPKQKPMSEFFNFGEVLGSGLAKAELQRWCPRSS